VKRNEFPREKSLLNQTLLKHGVQDDRVSVYGFISSLGSL